MALGSTQPLTEMSTRNLPGGKGQPVCGADNLTAICGDLDISEPHGPSLPVTGIALRSGCTFNGARIILFTQVKTINLYCLELGVQIPDANSWILSQGI
jgi:hypothetical protein